MIVQPRNRGTGAGVLLPALHAFSRDSLAPVVILPSDHRVGNEEALAEVIQRAAGAASDGHFVSLGMTPESLDGDSGWIVPAAIDEGPLRRVAALVERADPEAREQLRERGALWNSHIHASSPQALLGIYHHAAGWLLRTFLGAAAVNATRKELERLFDSIPPCDFARDIVARAQEHVTVMEVPPCGWSDIGTPDRLGFQRPGHIPHMGTFELAAQA